ncbi:MAG: hypothetical protein AAFR50_04355, partial [Pseudomonadota bacterium]
FRNPEVKALPKEEIFAAFAAFMTPDDAADLSVGKDTHIYFIAGKPVADTYIRYDHMAEDYAKLCADLDLDAPPIPELKRGPRGKQAIPYQEYYTPELRDLVGELFEKEVAAFGWTF